MHAVALFDLLARTRAVGTAGGPEVGVRLARFAGRLVEALLADLQRLRAYEQDLLAARATSNADGLDRDVLRTLWGCYDQWAKDAEEVLARVRVVCDAGQVVPEAARLEDAHGVVRARLNVTPEQVAHSGDEGHRAKPIPTGGTRN